MATAQQDIVASQKQFHKQNSAMTCYTEMAKEKSQASALHKELYYVVKD